MSSDSTKKNSGLNFQEAMQRIQDRQRITRQIWRDNKSDAFWFIDSWGSLCEARDWTKTGVATWDMASFSLATLEARDWLVCGAETAHVDIPDKDLYGATPLVLPASLLRANEAVQLMWQRRGDTDASGVEDAHTGEAFGCPVIVDVGHLAVAQSELRSIVPEIDPSAGRELPKGLKLGRNQRLLGYAARPAPMEGRLPFGGPIGGVRRAVICEGDWEPGKL